MGLSENEASHPVLGNIKQALELLVQQRWVWITWFVPFGGTFVFQKIAMNDEVIANSSFPM